MKHEIPNDVGEGGLMAEDLGEKWNATRLSHNIYIGIPLGSHINLFGIDEEWVLPIILCAIWWFANYEGI